MQFKSLGILAVLALVWPAAQASVYRCKSGDQVVYSDKPCESTQQSSQVKIQKSPQSAATPATPSPAASSAYATARAKDQAERRERDKQLQSATNEVTRMRAENADPAKCADARKAMARARQREPLTFNLDVSYFEFQQQESLYCGN